MISVTNCSIRLRTFTASPPEKISLLVYHRTSLFSNIDMEHFAEKWWLFLVFDIGSIALLKTPLGRGEGGNHSWLYVGLPMMIQPAEIVRLTFTVLLAKQIAWFRDDRRMKGLASLIFPAAHAGFMFVWIYILSKDAGSGLMYLVIYVGMAVAAGLAWYWFALGFGVLGLGIGGPFFREMLHINIGKDEIGPDAQHGPNGLDEDPLHLRAPCP